MGYHLQNLITHRQTDKTKYIISHMRDSR